MKWTKGGGDELKEKLLEAGYDIEIINGGVSGYDTATEIIYLERLVKEIAPDIVLLSFLLNDLFTNSLIKTLKGKKVQLHEQDKEIIVRAHKENINDYHSVILIKRILYSIDWLYCKLYSLSPRIKYYQHPFNKKAGRKIEITKNLLMRGIKLCGKHDIQFIVVSIPQQFQVIYSANGYQSENVSVTSIDSIFTQFAVENRFDWIPCLPSMTKHYKKYNKDLYYRYDGHLTPLGNKIVEETIYPVIEQHLSHLQ
jgi:lysophospholipase L1-like esterase